MHTPCRPYINLRVYLPGRLHIAQTPHTQLDQFLPDVWKRENTAKP